MKNIVKYTVKPELFTCHLFRKFWDWRLRENNGPWICDYFFITLLTSTSIQYY